MVKVQPVILKVLDDGMAESGVVLVVEDGEVLQQMSYDNVEEEDCDEDVVGDEPHDGSHCIATVAVQLGAVVTANLTGSSQREREREVMRFTYMYITMRILYTYIHVHNNKEH